MRKKVILPIGEVFSDRCFSEHPINPCQGRVSQWPWRANWSLDETQN